MEHVVEVHVGDRWRRADGRREEEIEAWMSVSYCKLPWHMRTAKGGHSGGFIMGEGADQGQRRSGTYVGGGACSAWEYVISREESVSA